MSFFLLNEWIDLKEGAELFIAMNLGELEKLLLNYFWAHEPADAKRVHGYFQASRGGSLNTVQSALDRLYKKKLLAREKIGHAFHYRAAISREDFIAHLINDVSRDFVGEGQNPLLAAFSSLTAKLQPGQLQQLEQLIESHKSRSVDPVNPDKAHD